MRVGEGLGYALFLAKLSNTQGGALCFKPFDPLLEAPAYFVWKKYQVFSKPASAFLQRLREML